MFGWCETDGYAKEFKALNKRYPTLGADVKHAYRLIGEHHAGRLKIAPGKYHKLTELDGWQLFKLEVTVSGLRPAQCPRFIHAVNSTEFVALAVAVHADNYDDSALQRSARERLVAFLDS